MTSDSLNNLTESGSHTNHIMHRSLLACNLSPALTPRIRKNKTIKYTLHATRNTTKKVHTRTPAYFLASHHRHPVFTPTVHLASPPPPLPIRLWVPSSPNETQHHLPAVTAPLSCPSRPTLVHTAWLDTTTPSFLPLCKKKKKKIAPLAIVKPTTAHARARPATSSSLTRKLGTRTT